MASGWGPWLATFLVLPFAFGCRGTSVKAPTSPESACVFGNILVDEQYVPDAVVMHEVGEVYAPPFASPPTAHTFTNGDFFFENVKPGRYYLARIKLGNELHTVAATSEAELGPMVFEVAPGAVHYAGSLRMTTGGAPALGAGSSNIQRAAQPDPRTILENLLPHLAKTGWDTRVRAQLGALGTGARAADAVKH